MGSGARGVYLTIAQTLKEEIDSGVIKRGEALTSESLLCERFGVARETVRRALAELERERVIVTIPGKGRFVGGGQVRPADVAEALRSELRSGTYAAGDRFISEAELIKRFGIGRYAARQALAALETEQLIAVRPGEGRFVL